MKNRITVRKRGDDGRKARAAVIVEFAVVVPLLLTILFGIIEYGYVFMVRQSLQNAAREGARQASLSTSVPPHADAIARVDQSMAGTGLTTYTTQIISGVCEETVTLTIPYNDVSVVGGFFGTNNVDLQGSATMRKEGCTPP